MWKPEARESSKARKAKIKRLCLSEVGGKGAWLKLSKADQKAMRIKYKSQLNAADAAKAKK